MEKENKHLDLWDLGKDLEALPQAQILFTVLRFILF